MHHKIRTQNDSSWECQAGTAKKASKAKLNTSAKTAERSSEKICYTKHKSESRISRLLLLLVLQKKLNTWLIQLVKGILKTPWNIVSIHRTHLLYLQEFSATSFSTKSFKHGRDSLQSILKPLFARPTRSIGQRLYPYIACETSVSPRSSPMEKRMFSQATHTEFTIFTTLPTVILTPRLIP